PGIRRASHQILKRLPAIATRSPSGLASRTQHWLKRATEVLPAESNTAFYQRMMTHWHNATDVVLGSPRISAEFPRLEGISDFVDWMLAVDMLRYLPDDILTKVDRASMSVGLEGRLPFLDPNLVEFAWTLPRSLKIRRGKGKWIIRQLLAQYVPKHLFERPKCGFEVPLGAWLRGPLKSWAEDLLSEQQLRSDGYFDPTPIRKRWEDHLSGRRNWMYQLWDILIFQTWLD